VRWDVLGDGGEGDLADTVKVSSFLDECFTGSDDRVMQIIFQTGGGGSERRKTGSVRTEKVMQLN
jgi:hypothetical protein